MKDLFNELDIKHGSSPGTGASDNTVIASDSLDMALYDGALAVIMTGTLADADATFTTSAVESDTGAFGGEETAVDAANLLGTTAAASFTFSADDKVFKLGFRRGGKRYKKVKVTPAANASAAPVAIVWVAAALQKPTVNPPT